MQQSGYTDQQCGYTDLRSSYTNPNSIPIINSGSSHNPDSNTKSNPDRYTCPIINFSSNSNPNIKTSRIRNKFRVIKDIKCFFLKK